MYFTPKSYQRTIRLIRGRAVSLEKENDRMGKQSVAKRDGINCNLNIKKTYHFTMPCTGV